MPWRIADKNAVLAAFTREDQRILSSRWRVLQVEQATILHEWRDKTRHLYFPLDAVLSLFASSPEGELVEAAITGAEGLIGYPAAFSGRPFPFRVVGQISGSVIEIREDVLRPVIDRNARCRSRIASYQNIFTTQLAQSSICNRAHSVEQRLARWLLAIRARSGLMSFPITHESLSEILCTNRPVVTVTARSLKASRVIEYRRGTVHIRDAAALARLSCSCYAIIHTELAQFLKASDFKSHPFSGAVS